MGSSDGFVPPAVKILDNGSDADRLTLVIVAEGYRGVELGQFAQDAQDFLDHMFNEPPLGEFRCAFNVYRLDVSSTDSGADDPTRCGGSGIRPATYFNASHCNRGLRRSISVNRSLVRGVVNRNATRQWDNILVLVNSPIGGGSGGGRIGISSISGSWMDTALHELGHSVFGLADEYDSWRGCGLDTNRNYRSGSEPAAPNVTKRKVRADVKWNHLIDPSTVLPTVDNLNCSNCNTRGGSIVLPAGTVGLFEGAKYYHCRIYRPVFSCIMRMPSSPFCPVCAERIRQTMEPYVDYLDRYACHAPVFPVRSGMACFVYVHMLLPLVNAFEGLVRYRPFSQWAWARCQIKRWRFTISHCMEGNDDPCIRL